MRGRNGVSGAVEGIVHMEYEWTGIQETKALHVARDLALRNIGDYYEHEDE